MKQRGFTLAEVLITLLIIGVVASIVIPALINDTRDQEYKTAWKKYYAELSHATRLLAINNGGTIKGLLSDVNIVNTFKPNFNVIKTCDGTTECWHDPNKWFEMDNDPKGYGADRAMILNSGVLISFNDVDTNCNLTTYGTPQGKSTCGYIAVDINGFKKPNMIGRDIYILHIQENGSTPPAGSIGDIWYYGINNCISSSGYACSASYLK